MQVHLMQAHLVSWLARHRAWVGTWMGLALAFIFFAPIVALPAFGSDGHWMALALNTPLDPFNVDWSVPPLFALLLRGALRLFGDSAIIVLRGLALALHIAIGVLLARWVMPQTQQRTAALMALALALFSPFAYRGLTALAFLPNLLAIALLLLAALCQQQQRSSLALAALIMGVLLVSLHTAPAQTLFALFIAYSGRVVLAGLIGLVLGKTVARIRPVLLVIALALTVGGAAINRDWVSAYTQASSAQRVARDLAHRPSPQQSLLMLNVPWALGPSTTSSAISDALLGDDQQLWPTDVAAQQALLLGTQPVTLTFSRLNDPALEIPSTIAGRVVYYGNDIAWSWANLRPTLSAFDAIVVGRLMQGQYQARVVGALGQSPAPTKYIARFEKGDSVVILTHMEACAPQGLAVSLWVQHAGSSQATAKLFRHALQGEAQIAGNDHGFLGGWLELTNLADGEWVRDVAYFDNLNPNTSPTAIRVGLYDWQSGERWLALHPDGAQWAENAVTIPVATPLSSCALGK